jgi:perosamine synthetase
MERIPVSGPSITEKEVRYVADAAANAWYGNSNIYHARFEEAFANYLGVRHAVALPSCTSAIHLSLLALGIGPGDEVIVPDVTWIASAAPITYVGATPVFADIDPETWCLSPESLAACVTPRTKAVIPVDLYGGLADWDKIQAAARMHGLALIEDAAEAIGSEYHGKKAGSLADTGVFSFHGSKTLTTGEGGMLVTDRADIHQRVLFLRDHGRPPGDRMFFNTEIAYKYKMSSMQAALGLAQLERIEELVASKRRIFSWYQSALSGVDGLQLNRESAQTKNTYWMVTALFDENFGLSKSEIMEHLSARNIDSRPFFHPLSNIPAYRDTPQATAARQRNTNSYKISERGINLPSGLTLTRSTVEYVCEVVRDLIRSPLDKKNLSFPGQ